MSLTRFFLIATINTCGKTARVPSIPPYPINPDYSWKAEIHDNAAPGPETVTQGGYLQEQTYYYGNAALVRLAGHHKATRMSKRRKQQSWPNFGNKRRKTQKSMNRYRRLNGIEPLEERQVLTAYTIEATESSASYTANELITAAFERSSDLSNYTQAQMDAAVYWVVKTDGTIADNQFFSQTGLFAEAEFLSISNTYFLGAGNLSSSTIISNLSSNPHIEYFYPQIDREKITYSVPDDYYYDEQWHLSNDGQETSLINEADAYASWGEDIRVEGAWDITTGEGIVVAIVDDGVYYVHPDLAANYDPSLSYDFVTYDANPIEVVNQGDYHGTAVAGLAVGVGDNSEGITGVAYNSTFAAIRLLGYNPFGEGDTFQATYDALTYLNQDIDIYNNSWGYGVGRTIADFDPIETQALITAVNEGRGGLGSILVVSTGNSAEDNDRADNDSFSSTRYTIGVTGFSANGGVVEYAEGGASTWVAAPTGTNPPGVGVTTTDAYGGTGVADVGYNDGETIGELDDEQYTNGFNGTSASAPIASGAIALILAAAEDNGIELSLRDLKNILALSSRKVDANDSGWQTDLQPLFYDPAVVNGIPIGLALPLGPGVSALPTKVDEETQEIISDTAAMYFNATNSAGYFVHDSTEATGYGFGAIDVEYAVRLASTWHGVNFADNSSFVATEANVQVITGSLFGPINIPAAEATSTDGYIIPGGVGGVAGFAEFFDFWLDPEEDEIPEDIPVNTRGGSIDITIPAGLSIEDIEITVDIEIASEDSDMLRMTLVSPDGTQSELTNFTRDGELGNLTDTGQISHTYTTVRHWGERSEGSGRIDPITGEYVPANVQYGNNGEVVAGVWTLVFENWSGSAATINGVTISFYGTDTPGTGFENLGGRIQGTIGLDTDEDGAFNFTNLTAQEFGDITSDKYGESLTETPVLTSIEINEPYVRGVTVYVDYDGDAILDANEPYMITGADGNFYFDLAYNQIGETYQIRVITPDGYTNLGDDVLEYTIGIQDDSSVQSTFVDANFLFAPDEVTFEGNVYADFNLNQTQDLDEADAEGFRVFADLNENGVLDYTDLNGNRVYDDGIDLALEPVVVTDVDGSYVLTVSTADNFYTGYFGTQYFLSSFYIGEEYYTLMLDYSEGWTPTSDEVSAEGFNTLANGDSSPGMAYYRIHVFPGETYTDLTFGVAPTSGASNGTISGFVFSDINQNGNHDAGEGGLAGATVYLDLDKSGDLSTGDLSVITGTNGSYLFEDLLTGTYDIRIIPPAGYESEDSTIPIGGYYPNIILGDGGAAGVGYLDFGYYNPDLSVVPSDFGDLPETYGTASHYVVDGFYLGAGVSTDSSDLPSAGADADTGDDGVVFQSQIVAGATVRIDVTASSNALFLQGWIDFNNDGDFNDAGEHLSFGDVDGNLLPYSQQLLLDEGLNELTFVVPEEVSAASLAVRFRYGEGGYSQFNEYAGQALIGEVEDYIVAATISTSFIEPVAGDYDGNSIVDAADYQVYKATFGSTIDLRADGNADGVVDMMDYVIWRNNLGNEATVVQSIAAVAAMTGAAATVGDSSDAGSTDPSLASSSATGDDDSAEKQVADNSTQVASAQTEEPDAEPTNSTSTGESEESELAEVDTPDDSPVAESTFDDKDTPVSGVVTTLDDSNVDSSAARLASLGKLGGKDDAAFEITSGDYSASSVASNFSSNSYLDEAFAEQDEVESDMDHFVDAMFRSDDNSLVLALEDFGSDLL